MRKRQIEIGHTNGKKYVIDDQVFVIEKNYTGFNHLLNYSELASLSFVPKLLKETPKIQEWQYIDGKELSKENLSLEVLSNLAKNLRILHKSTLNFPKNNLRRRINAYLEIINASGKKVDVINRYYKEMQRTLANMRQINPVHNDVWGQNLLVTNDHKVFLVDWEYATMGDKHFDLAFFIESMQMNFEQEKSFLQAYNAVDQEISFDKWYLFKHKRLSHYITICWAHAQPNLPFNTAWMEKFLDKTANYQPNDLPDI